MATKKTPKVLSVVTTQPIPGLMCGPNKVWHHGSKKGIYLAVQDPPGTITLTPYTFAGETKVVHSMEELRQVDVE